MKTTNVLLGLVVIALIVVGIALLRKPTAEAPATSQAGDTSMPQAAMGNMNMNPEADNTSGGTSQAAPAPTQAAGLFTGIDFDGNTVIGDGPIPKVIPQAGVFRMSIKNYAYVNASTGQPIEGKFPADVEVIWTNDDSVAHTVTFDNGMADSGAIQPGKSFAFYFTKPGTYAYHCTYHPNMHGSITISNPV